MKGLVGIFGIFCSVFLITCSCSQKSGQDAIVSGESALLKDWSGPYGGVPPWDKVKTNEFVGAFDKAIEMATADLNAIAADPAAPNFENTIVAMEQSGGVLNRLVNIFWVYTSNLNLGDMPQISKTVSPKLSQYNDSIYANEALFKRIEAVYESDEAKNLDSAQKRLLEKTYKNFVRRGAKLSAAQKKELSELNTQLAKDYTDFSQNLQNDEKLHTIITEEAKLKGLSADLIKAYKEAADGLGKKGWAVKNTRSAMDPFLTFAEDRGMREIIWRKYYNRGDNGDANDNNAIISRILKNRAKRAKLLGYDTHAHWKLEAVMAKTPERAMDLMMQVWPKAVKRVEEEVADMQKIADGEGAGITIEGWDYRYYAEKVRKAKYDLDFNLVKPYMQLEKLVEGMMWASTQLFGFQYKRINNVPIFHPDVRVFEVLDKNGKHVGLWYLDPYAREGKDSGAWMMDYRAQENINGKWISPIVSNNSNFLKTTDGKPVLISWDDALTLFHEFGHALHGLLSNVTYPSQSGTNVARDYVEFPSQLFEHWLSTDEVLSRFAVHVDTGKPLPKELLQKIKNAAKFNQGFATVEYLASALVDMKLHLAGDVTIDPDKFEKDALKEIGMPKEIVMRHRTPQFAHLFSGDSYSAGYYSYLWSDTLTADSAELFEEKGSYYDKGAAKSLTDNIFAVGDTIDPLVGFRNFRGRDVDIKALLRKRGFPTE